MDDRRKCQAYAASPAEPGGLPVMLARRCHPACYNYGMERGAGPFSKPWKLVERAESFEVQDLASRMRAFVYFSNDRWRGVFYPGSEPRANAGPRPHAVISTESDTHRPTPNVVMVGFIGAPSQWELSISDSPRLQHLPLGRAQEPHGDFAGWTDDQARGLINDLAALVRDKLTFNPPMRTPCLLIGRQRLPHTLVTTLQELQRDDPTTHGLCPQKPL
jgi:hypothetical protein